MPNSILVLGGGVFGLTAALILRARGWAVTLLDQGRVPHPDAASTDISKVVRMDYGMDLIYTEMGEAALAGWAAWNDAWERPLYHADGFLVMTRDEEMRSGSFEHDSYSFLTKRGHALRRTRRVDLARLHPAWNAERYGDGYLNPHGGWAESGAVIAQLRAAALPEGITIHEQCALEKLIDHGARTQDGREWRADIVLAALGAWTPFAFPHLQNVMRTTAQPVIHFRPARADDFRPPAFPVWGADIGRTGWYGFPANTDGIVKVANHGPGRIVSHPAQPRGVTDEEVAKFIAFLHDTFPALASAPIAATRECWYCDTFDGHFFIDHDPARDGLVIAAGDSGHAFKFAPVLGGIIADVVERRENKWSARFRWRKSAHGGGDGARAGL